MLLENRISPPIVCIHLMFAGEYVRADSGLVGGARLRAGLQELDESHPGQEDGTAGSRG